MRRLFSHTDGAFLLALGVLVALGLIVLSSASAPLAYERFHDRSHYVVRQLLAGVVPGIVAFVVALRLHRRTFERLAVPLFFISVALLALVFVPGLGVTHGRTQSWLGIGPLVFQPAEIAKLGLILALAAWATTRRPLWFDLPSWSRGLLPFVGVVGAVALLLVLQPDIGTLAVIVAIALGVAFAAGMPFLHLAALIAAGIAALTALIAAAPYRLARLTVFLHPDFDPRGIGYQVNQALLAVGSGGWTGLGLGHSRQKFSFLPEVISDSIFAILAEEIGFLFAAAFLALVAYVVWRVLVNAMRATDAFDRLVLAGIGVWWGAQTLVNVGAMVGLLPLTGIPLPFVSYGGTAMVVSLAAAGIVLNVSRQSAGPASGYPSRKL